MRRKLHLFGLTWTLASSAALLAQTPAKEAGPSPRPEPPLWHTLDQDGDGTISAAEIANAAAALKKLDADGDGKLTGAEFRPPHPEDGLNPPRHENRRARVSEGNSGREERAPERPAPPPTEREGETKAPSAPPTGGEHRPPRPVLEQALDANNDGEISAEEIAKAPVALKKLDKNGDGKISPEELGPPPAPEGGPRHGPGDAPLGDPVEKRRPTSN